MPSSIENLRNCLDHYKRNRATVISAIYFLLITTLIIVASSREIRPSDHGLSYQNLHGNVSPEMRSFFAGSPELSLPAAHNDSDPYQGITGGVKPATLNVEENGHARGHVRIVLLVTSLVCGIAGLALAVVVLLLCFQIHRRTNNKIPIM